MVSLRKTLPPLTQLSEMQRNARASAPPWRAEPALLPVCIHPGAARKFSAGPRQLRDFTQPVRGAVLK